MTTELLQRIFQNQVNDPAFCDRLIGTLSVSNPTVLLEAVEWVEDQSKRKEQKLDGPRDGS